MFEPPRIRSDFDHERDSELDPRREEVDNLQPVPGKVPRVRRYRDADGHADSTPRLRRFLQAASRSAGQPLPRRLLDRLEAALHADLSAVRVHTGTASQLAAAELSASAFTVGDQIHFAAGRFDPDSVSGQRLIAHEAAHTVEPDARDPDGLEISSPRDPDETRAESFADQFIAARPDAVAAPPDRTDGLSSMWARRPGPILEAGLGQSRALCADHTTRSSSTSANRSTNRPANPAEKHPAEAHQPQKHQTDNSGAPAPAPAESRSADLRRMRAVLEAIGGAGRPLPGPIASDFGQRLGVDLDDVRVHDDPGTHQATAALGAYALTSGSAIAFAAGAYQPTTGIGRQLLAHELIHVAQQKRAGSRMSLAASLATASPSSALEREADHGAGHLAAGRPFAIGQPGVLPAVSFQQRPPAAPAPAGPDSPGPSSAPGGSPAPGGGDAPAPATPANQPGGPNSGPSPAPGGPTPAGAPGGPTPAPTPGGPAPAPAPGGPTPADGPGPAAPGPDGKPAGGYTAEPDYACKLDDSIRQLIDQRADPNMKDRWSKLMGEADAMRIGSLQFAYQPRAIWHNLWNSFIAWDSFKEHGRQVGMDNAYRGSVDSSGWSKLQVGIEGARGVLHIVGDIASSVAGIAGIVALVTAIITAIGPNPITAAISAIAGAVSLIATVIKIILDFIDTILSAVQLCINIQRLKHTKDPGERARICQLIKKESGDMASNAAGLTVQIVTLVVGVGVGAVVEKATGGGSLLGSAAKQFKQIGQAAKGVLPSQWGRAGAWATLVRSEAAGAAAAATSAVVAKQTMSGLAKAEQNGLNEMLITLQGIELKQNMAALSRTVTINAINTPAGFALSMGGGEGKVAANLGGGAPGGGTAGGIDKHVSVESRYVGFWPGLLEDMNSRRGLINNASHRMVTQYNLAEGDADKSTIANVKAKFGEIQQDGHRIRATALGEKEKAYADAQRTRDMEEQKRKAEEARGKLKPKQDEADRAFEKMKPDLLPTGGSWWDKLKDATLGWIGKQLAAYQKKIQDSILKWAVGKSEMTKAEAIAAGIDPALVPAKEGEKTAQSEMGEVSTNDTIQREVNKMRAGLSTHEQNAMQGMVDAMRWIDSLDQIDQSYAQTIAEGEAYIAKVEQLIKTEQEVEGKQAGITAAYIAPITNAVSTFQSDAAKAPDALATGARAAYKGAFGHMGSLVPDGDFSKGTQMCEQAVVSHQQAVKSAGEIAGSAVAGHGADAQGLVSSGSKEYDQVDRIGYRLQSDINTFWTYVAQVQQSLVAGMQGVVSAYATAMKKGKSSATPPGVSAPPSSGDATPAPASPPGDTPAE